jgi:hypothetical protein
MFSDDSSSSDADYRIGKIFFLPDYDSDAWLELE